MAARCSSTKSPTFRCALQLKLLRVLDHGEVLPVGADTPLRSRFRVISATNQNLRQKVEAGEFRHDLFFRLCTFEIALPPLRDRRDDIALLAQHFASQFAGQPVAFAEETLAELERRPWYGNVRELRSAIEHALVLARRGVVMPEHLPPPLPKLWQRGAEHCSGAARRIGERCLANGPATAGRSRYGRHGLRPIPATSRAAALSGRDEPLRPALRAGGPRAGSASHDTQEEAHAV